MKQVVQPIAGGSVRVVEVPTPAITSTEVLVQTLYSVISPGTERALTGLARSSLVSKARARPDLVRQVVRKARVDGLKATMKSVRSRLEEDMPLGYSACGTVLEVGESVEGVLPGQIVATGGAGKANHAELQAVPGLLCSVVPDEVDPADAAFATIGSIALHALRLGEIEPGASIAVIGLGLVGQLVMRLALASGCRVAGLDIQEFPVAKARAAGATALIDEGEETTREILSWTHGRGVDAVIVTASGKSSAAMLRAPELCRDRASLVVVGDTGLQLDRGPLYEKELAIRFARSYGPGRYDRSYEDWGVDYPIGHVRWTEGRNLEAFLDLLSRRAVKVDDLVTHRFDFAQVEAAFDLVTTQKEPLLGIQLAYEGAKRRDSEVIVHPTKKAQKPSIGLIGTGTFARKVLVPSLKQAGFAHFVSAASASGLSARNFSENAGFRKAVSGADSVISDPDVDVVVIATPHDSHATLVIEGLEAGKHVFCEKPLALTLKELEEIEAVYRRSDSVLFVGFNRRWSEPIRRVNQHFGRRSGPLSVTYRVFAGRIPEDHWYQDRRQGGRLIGEVCHFVDTCNAIIQAPVKEVDSVRSGPGDSVLVNLRYEDGSTAGISYLAATNPAFGKEHLEIVGRGSIVIISDFRAVELDGRRVKGALFDKGHVLEMREFLRQIASGTRDDESIESTRWTLVAASRMLGS